MNRWWADGWKVWGWTCCAWRRVQTVTQSLALRQESSAYWDAAQPGRGCCFGTYDALCMSNWIYTQVWRKVRFFPHCSCRKFKVTCEWMLGFLFSSTSPSEFLRPSRVPLWCPHREQPTVSSTLFSQLNITQSFWNAVRSLPAGNLTNSSRGT